MAVGNFLLDQLSPGIVLTIGEVMVVLFVEDKTGLVEIVTSYNRVELWP